MGHDINAAALFFFIKNTRSMIFTYIRVFIRMGAVPDVQAIFLYRAE